MANKTIATNKSIKTIVIHHSNTSFGNAAFIDNMHRSREDKFDMIGYHWVVGNGWLTRELFEPLADGLIETGRHYLVQGAHCKENKGNHNSIGICLIGDDGGYTSQQLNSLKNLIGSFRERFPEIEVKLHSDIADTACPLVDSRKLFNTIMGL